MFIDETKVENFGSHRRTFVRRVSGQRYACECLVPTVKFGGGSVLCWGEISSKGVIPLNRIDGIMMNEIIKFLFTKYFLIKFEIVQC